MSGFKLTKLCALVVAGKRYKTPQMIRASLVISMLYASHFSRLLSQHASFSLDSEYV